MFFESPAAQIQWILYAPNHVVNHSDINIDRLKVVGLMDAILTARATLVTAVQWVKRDNSPPSSYPSPKIWDWVQNSFKNPRGINLNKQCPFIYLLHTEIITCPGIQKSYVQQSSCLRLEVLNHRQKYQTKKNNLVKFLITLLWYIYDCREPTVVDLPLERMLKSEYHFKTKPWKKVSFKLTFFPSPTDTNGLGKSLSQNGWLVLNRRW